MDADHSPAGPVEEGLALLQQGKLQEAVASFQAALRQNAEDANAHLYLGITHAQLQQPAQATAHLEAALRVHEAPQTHYNLALVQESQGMTEAAARHLRRALALNPEYPAAREALQRVEAATRNAADPTWGAAVPSPAAGSGPVPPRVANSTRSLAGARDARYQPQARPSSLATASLVLGILALWMGCATRLSVFFALAAIVLGIAHLRREQSARGMANAGIATGGLALCWAVLVLGLTGHGRSARMAYRPSYTPRTYPSGAYTPRSYPSSLAPTRIPATSNQVRRRVPIQSALQPYVGQPAPDLRLADLDGNLHSLSGNRGKVVLLHFWAPG